MTTPAFLLALAALFVPQAPAQQDSRAKVMDQAGFIGAEEPAEDDAADGFGFGRLSELLDDTTWDQVRIEQRLIIRITPRAPGPDLSRDMAAPPAQMRERKTSKCLPVPGIFGVKPISDSRLMLFMRDRRLIAADLDRM